MLQPGHMVAAWTRVVAGGGDYHDCRAQEREDSRDHGHRGMRRQTGTAPWQCPSSAPVSTGRTCRLWAALGGSGRTGPARHAWRERPRLWALRLSLGCSRLLEHAASHAHAVDSAASGRAGIASEAQGKELIGPLLQLIEPIVADIIGMMDELGCNFADKV